MSRLVSSLACVTSKQLAISKKINALVDRELADEAFPSGASAGHSLACLTPYKHAFVVVAAAFEELHP